MTCGSKARLASRRPKAAPAPNGSVAARSAFLLLQAAVLLGPALPAGAQPGPRSAAAGAWPPALELVAPHDADPRLRALVTEDGRWLAAQPPLLLAAPVVAAEGVDDAAGEVVWGDLAPWLQQAQRLAATVEQAPADSLQAAAAPVHGVRDLLSALRDRWLARGHLAAGVWLEEPPVPEPPAPGRRIRIDPGPRFTWGALTVGGDDLPGRQSLLDAWLPRPGDAFRPDLYLEAAAGVVLGCAELGYPFASWLTRSLRADRATAQVEIEAVLVPGPRMVIGPQRTNLPRARGESFLIRAGGLRSGQTYRESDLRRARQRLQARELYTRVDEPLVHLTTAADTVGILWLVEPQRKANRLSVVLGLSQRDEGGARLSGQVDLELPNLAGSGRSLRAGWRDDGLARSLFGFRYLEPLVMGTPLDTDIALSSEVVTEAYTLFQASNRWRLPLVSFWGLELGVGWDRTTYPAGELQGARRLRGRAAVLRQRGDRARSGWSGSFAVETARRSAFLRAAADDAQGATGGGQLGKLEHQRLLEIDLDGEAWLRTELSVAARASFRQIDADTRPSPLPELYRFGGAASLRGYREDEFLGERAAWGGLEVRFGRARRSRVYTFVDVGYFERIVRAAADAGGGLATSSGTRSGFGLGLLTLAAPGQINLAVGFPGAVSFESAMLHVSLVGSF